MNKKHGLPAGLQLTNRGYIRVTKGPFKWKLLHRRVMEIALEQTDPRTLAALGIKLDRNGKCSLPDEWDVHHVDRVKIHNCIENLLLLDHVIHARLFNET